MIIYALSQDYEDHSEQDGRTSPLSHTTGLPYDTQTINVLRSYTMEWLANDIKNRVDTFRLETGRASTKIWLLRIASHGNAGLMSIGRGLDRETAVEFEVLNENYFVPIDEGGQGIELWGCSVASAAILNPPPLDLYLIDDDVTAAFDSYNLQLGRVTDKPEVRRGSQYPSILRGARDVSGSVEEGRGYRMMHALATAANTKVTAAYDIQIPDLHGSDWEWEGTGLLSVFPDGEYEMLPLS